MTIAPDVTYIASTIPAQVVRTAGTTLFHIGEIHLGDAMRWVELGRINGLLDPWLHGASEILLPPVLSQAELTGILGL